MPRVARKYLNTNFFHVIMQGINKEYIFDEERYKKKYKNLLFAYLRKYDINLLSYCIMSNHVHLIIYVEDNAKMSRYIHDINTTFSKYYNEQKNRVGIVFRSRYKSQPIYDYKYLHNCIAYVHNNPVKANIVKYPREYKYSSYNSFINGIVDKKSIEIIYGTGIDYIQKFKLIHEKPEIEEFDDYVEDIDYDQKVKELLNENIGEIIMNEKLLEKVIKNLVIDNKIPIKKVCDIFKLSRYKISKILKSK